MLSIEYTRVRSTKVREFGRGWQESRESDIALQRSLEMILKR